MVFHLLARLFRLFGVLLHHGFSSQTKPLKLLEREEYIEQAHLFRVIGQRLSENMPMQELLAQIRHEILSTARLPLAIDYMLAELKHAGTMSTAMLRLKHYFTPFQAYVMQEAENDRGRFDFRIAVEILEAEAKYRASECTRQGLFLFQFECLCRNRMRYDPGLGAIASDDFFDEEWKEWIYTVRRQMGLVDFADMIYVRSTYSIKVLRQQNGEDKIPDKPMLFGEQEGKIAFANRRKDPLFLFSALQRQLGYPAVPRPKAPDESQKLLRMLELKVERLEARIKLLEEEEKGGIDITKFYTPSSPDLKRVAPPDDIGFMGKPGIDL